MSMSEPDFGGFKSGDIITIKGDGQFVIDAVQSNEGIIAGRLVRTHYADGSPVRSAVTDYIGKPWGPIVPPETDA